MRTVLRRGLLFACIAFLACTSAMAGYMAATPTSEDFGIVVLGTSMSRPVVVTNVSTMTLSVVSFGLEGDSSEFSYGPCLPTDLVPGQSCTMNVTFAPTTLGSHNARLVFRNAGSTLVEAAVELSARGAASIQWGVVGPGAVSSSPALEGTCDATGCFGYVFSLPATLTPAPAPGARFVGWSGDCSGTGACMLNAAASRVTANFEPFPRIEIAMPSLRFGEEFVGEIGTPVLVAATTSSAGTLHVSSVDIVGPQAADFGQAGNCIGAIVPHGFACDVAIVFTPKAAGPRNATLVFRSDDPDAPSKTIPLSGIGAVAVPDAPGNVIATPANRSASLSFMPPASDGGSAITSYSVACLPGDIVASGPASPILVNGLANGTTYFCAVRASNAAGAGPMSSYVFVKPPH